MGKSSRPGCFLAALVAAATLGADGACAPGTARPQERLFTLIDSAELVLTVQQAERLDLLRQDATSKEIRLARIDMTRLAAGDPLDLGPAAGRTVLLLQVRIERRDADDYSWFGENPETGATAALVVHGEEITGTIQAGQELYRIRSLGDGLHAVIEVDQEAFPPDHPPEFDDEPGNHLP